MTSWFEQKERKESKVRVKRRLKRRVKRVKPKERGRSKVLNLKPPPVEWTRASPGDVFLVGLFLQLEGGLTLCPPMSFCCDARLA